MAKKPEPDPYREPPEAGIGGEGSPFDLSVLAPVTDREIEQGIRVALVLDPDIDAREVEVSVESGIASLSGSLSTAEERRRAIDVAGMVHGVRHVVDRFRD